MLRSTSSPQPFLYQNVSSLQPPTISTTFVSQMHSTAINLLSSPPSIFQQMLTKQPRQKTSKEYQRLSGCPALTRLYHQTKGHAALSVVSCLTRIIFPFVPLLRFILPLPNLAGAQSVAATLTLITLEIV